MSPNRVLMLVLLLAGLGGAESAEDAAGADQVASELSGAPWYDRQADTWRRVVPPEQKRRDELDAGSIGGGTSLFASRPVRNSAPASTPRRPSPVQSTKMAASMSKRSSVLGRSAKARAIRPSRTSAPTTVVFSSSVRFGSLRHLS